VGAAGFSSVASGVMGFHVYEGVPYFAYTNADPALVCERFAP
jgi:hypothetical protein